MREARMGRMFPSSLKCLVLVIVLLGLGLRRGEAIGLRWEDVDFDVRQVRIRRRVSRVRFGIR